MSYDETLAGRMRRLLVGTRGMDEKKMFGGIAFLLHGKMCCGIIKTDLVVRVGPEEHGKALKQPHARPMDFTGRPLRGFVYVATGGIRTASALRAWVTLGAEVAMGSAVKSRRGNPKAHRRSAR